MGLLDGALAAVFGAAFGALFRSAVLHKSQEADNGTGAFSTTVTDHPVRVSRDALSAADRAASGLPATVVRFTVLRAGLAVPVDLDDGLTLEGATYRVIRVDSDPAGASMAVAAVPA